MSEECRFVVYRGDAESRARCIVHRDDCGTVAYFAALCTHAADALRAERDKLQRYPFEPICLICGRLTPCMTEADLKPSDPGVPCTFDPTPRQLFEENATLRAKVVEAEGDCEALLLEIGNLSREIAPAQVALEGPVSVGKLREVVESLLATRDAQVGAMREAIEYFFSPSGGSIPVKHEQTFGRPDYEAWNKRLEKLHAALASGRREEEKP